MMRSQRPSMKTCTGFILLLLLLAGCQKGNDDLSTSTEIYRSERWIQYNSITVGDFPEGMVYDMAPGLNGELWFVTTNGVVQFDGAEWRTYTTLDGLAENNNVYVYVDANGVVWTAGTNTHQISMFDGVTWQVFDGNGYKITSITSDTNGTIWFGTNPGGNWEGDPDEGGLIRYDGREWMEITVKDGLCSNHISDLIVDSDNNVWAAGLDCVSYLRDDRWISYELDDVLPNYRQGVTPNNLLVESNNVLSMIVDHALVSFDHDSWRVYSNDLLKKSYLVNAMDIASDGSLWIGTVSNNGSSPVYMRQSNHWLEFSGLPFSIVFSLHVNDDNSVWFCTESGVYVYMQ